MILLDSSFLVAYANTRDKNHGSALKIQKDIDDGKYGTMVITDYIFDEIVTRMFKEVAYAGNISNYGQAILDTIELMQVDENIFNASWEIFKEQKGTRFSFTDCTSIAACRISGIAAIGTFDLEFEKVKDLNVIY
jgi:predicted nucleic acid-binding protein